jgi:hypothetical protein
MQTFIVAVIVILSLLYVIRYIYQSIRGYSHCNKCSSCFPDPKAQKEQDQSEA